jgi:hypothetical protein
MLGKQVQKKRSDSVTQLWFCEQNINQFVMFRSGVNEVVFSDQEPGKVLKRVFHLHEICKVHVLWLLFWNVVHKMSLKARTSSGGCFRKYGFQKCLPVFDHIINLSLSIIRKHRALLLAFSSPWQPHVTLHHERCHKTDSLDKKSKQLKIKLTVLDHIFVEEPLRAELIVYGKSLPVSLKACTLMTIFDLYSEWRRKNTDLLDVILFTSLNFAITTH